MGGRLKGLGASSVSFSLQTGELRVGRRDSPRMEDARATGRGGNMVRTVSSLGSAGSGLGG